MHMSFVEIKRKIAKTTLLQEIVQKVKNLIIIVIEFFNCFVKHYLFIFNVKKIKILLTAAKFQFEKLVSHYMNEKLNN